MRHVFIVSVDIDTTAIVSDPPPENIITSIQDELTSSFGDSSIRRALGVIDVEVQYGGPEVCARPGALIQPRPWHVNQAGHIVDWQGWTVAEGFSRDEAEMVVASVNAFTRPEDWHK